MSFIKRDPAPEGAERQAPPRRSARKGVFSAGLVVLAVAAVIIFNLLAAQIPASKAQLDLTESKIYNITDTSVAYLQGMEEDVEIHVLANKELVDSRIVRFLEKYVSLSDHLTLEYVDPMVFPSALSAYGADAYTIVVSCAATGRQETVNLGEIIGYDEMAYYMYQQQVETDFDAEGLMTSAIDGVLSSAGRVAYETSGHDETALPADMRELLGKVHLTVNSVNLLTGGGIPADCDLLVMNLPTRDLADDELAMIEEYLAQGGQVIYCMAAQLEPLPNFEKLCLDYGLSAVPGIVADTQRYYQNNPYLFFPILDASVDAVGSLSGDATLLFYGSRGMTLADPVRESISVTPFLTTSDGGVAVVDEENQVEGVFVVGAVATEAVDDGITARFTVYGSDSLCSASLVSQFTNVDNHSLFVSSAIAGFEDVNPIDIPPVSLAEETNTVTTGGIWALLFILVIPAALLVAGLIRWARRRKQ